jgi:hypothetical protein
MDFQPSFKNYTIISCGTLRPELEHLRESGFLNPKKIFYAAPGLHENYRKLKEQLINNLAKAADYSKNIIVVYGSSCYLDLQKEPPESIDDLINRSEGDISRIEAARCIDMLVDSKNREKIRKGEKVYWLTPGWLKYWKAIFTDWDAAKANETFPRYDKAIILDALGFYGRYIQDFPEKVLEFSDWMGIPIEAHKISLSRLKNLLLEEIK